MNDEYDDAAWFQMQMEQWWYETKQDEAAFACVQNPDTATDDADIFN